LFCSSKMVNATEKSLELSAAVPVIL
jgi:hypothetical protein